MSKVSKVDYKGNLKGAVKEAVGALGGFGEFVKAGETVFLKPNFNTADPYPASSDIEFIKAVIELCYEQGAKMVMVGDSSTISANTRKVMQKLGVFELENLKNPARVYALEERGWIKKDIPGGKYLKSAAISEVPFRADKIIYLPCLKTHFIASYTGALKLSVGLMKPLERIKLHAKRAVIQQKIAELNTLIKPDLIIMDGRKCFIDKGPVRGKLAEPGKIMASKSRVDIDIEGIKTIQEFEENSLKDINPEELPQIKRARELKIL